MKGVGIVPCVRKKVYKSGKIGYDQNVNGVG